MKNVVSGTNFLLAQTLSSNSSSRFCSRHLTKIVVFQLAHTNKHAFESTHSSRYSVHPFSNWRWNKTFFESLFFLALFMFFLDLTVLNVWRLVLFLVPVFAVQNAHRSLFCLLFLVLAHSGFCSSECLRVFLIFFIFWFLFSAFCSSECSHFWESFTNFLRILVLILAFTVLSAFTFSGSCVYFFLKLLG